MVGSYSLERGEVEMHVIDLAAAVHSIDLLLDLSCSAAAANKTYSESTMNYFSQSAVLKDAFMLLMQAVAASWGTAAATASDIHLVPH